LIWLLVAAHGQTAAMVLTILLGTLLGSWPGQALAILITGSRTEARGRMIGIYQIATYLIGGLGPVLTGALSDAMGGKDHLAGALAATLFLNLLAAPLFMASCRLLPSVADHAATGGSSGKEFLTQTPGGPRSLALRGK
jgi:cyanate permease